MIDPQFMIYALEQKLRQLEINPSRQLELEIVYLRDALENENNIKETGVKL